MASPLLVGPLLGIEGKSNYTLCFSTPANIADVVLLVEGQSFAAVNIASVASGIFWRAEFIMAASEQGRLVSYQLVMDGLTVADRHARSTWQFYVPGISESPRMAYASCNGFSDLSLREKTSNPYGLWESLSEQHESLPFSLLLMGGDQLYADSLWTEVKSLSDWSELPRCEKIKRKASKLMREKIEQFYDKLYRDRWSNKSMSLMLASVPSVMMWDDHDIFDGWGSYPEDIQGCEVYRAIFQSAKKYFELFQIRSLKNQSLLNAGAGHYAFAFSFRQYHIVAIDNRSERTLQQVMSEQQWQDFNRVLSAYNEAGDLLLLTAVPVVYRDFSFTESAFDVTPWEEELTDDLKDHWRAKEHQGERARLIMRLLDNAAKRKGRTLLLSGDVHIGCLGVVTDRRTETPVKIHQVVSSGIVHPSPSMIEWYGIMAVTNDRSEYLNEDQSIKVSMLKPHGANQYIRSRNFVTLEQGSDKKLWVNWICEHKDKPVYPLEA